MKTLRMIAVGLMFTALFAISAFAQVGGAQPTSSGKVAVIDSGAFGVDKEGITKYIAALNQLDTEFAPKQKELETMSVRIKTLADEISKLSAPGSPAGAAASIQSKREEGERLQVELKRKQEDGQAAFQKRQGEVLGPIMQDIYKAVQEFSKKNGYAMIFDIAKMADNGTILALDETADVTKAFVTFYNARPAGTAATATPK